MDRVPSRILVTACAVAALRAQCPSRTLEIRSWSGPAPAIAFEQVRV